MAASFFTGTDDELYHGSNNFSEMISATPAAFGLSAPMAASYATLNANYAAAYEALQVPSTRTKGQTAAKNAAKILLKVAASDLAKIIEGTSTVTDQQKIDLGLNVRATPTPVGELTKPGNFKAELDETGTVKLLWKCAQPKSASGVTYQVWRRIGDAGEFSCLGSTGRKYFTDATIPAGSAAVTYRVQATRSTSASPWAQFIVSFGAAPAGGGMAIASVQETSAKMAA